MHSTIPTYVNYLNTLHLLVSGVTVSLIESSYVLTEGEGVVICVELVGVLERDAAVNITTVEGTATGRVNSTANQSIILVIMLLYHA